MPTRADYARSPEQLNTNVFFERYIYIRKYQMSIIPGDKWPTDSSSVTAGFIATPPIQYNPVTKFLSVNTASAASSGVVSTTAQTFAGAKTFAATPLCSTLPSVAEALCNRAYVDGLIAQSLSWKDAIIEFLDMDASPPPTPTTGDRYIATLTSGAFTKDYIYQYTGSAWLEIATEEGDATFVKSATSALYPNMLIYYTGTSWQPFSSAITHSNLLNLSADDHAQYVKVSGRVGDAVSIPNITASTSTTTGALTVTGGIGCAATVFAEKYRVPNVENAKRIVLWDDYGGTDYRAHSIGTGSGEVMFSTGLINQYFNFYYGSGAASRVKCIEMKMSNTGGYLSVLPTTASTSTATGALIVAGGAGVAGAIHCNQLNITNGTNAYLYLGQSASERIQLEYIHNATPAQRTLGISVPGSAWIAQMSAVATTISPTTASTSTTTGALIVNGGIGCAARLSAGNIYSYGNIVAQGASLNAFYSTYGYGLNLSAPYSSQCWAQSNWSWDTYTGFYFKKPGTSGNTSNFAFVLVESEEAASSTTSGALRVAGGCGIAGDLYVGGSLNITGAIVVDWSGGANFFKAAQADTESYYVKFGKEDSSKSCGSLQYYYATDAANRYLALNLHSCNGLKITDSLASITHTAASTSASTGALTVAGGLGVAGAIYTGGEIVSLATTASTNTVSGAIVSYGGVGIAGAIYCGGGLYVTPTGSSDKEPLMALSAGIGVGNKISVGFGKAWNTDECAAWCWVNETLADDRRVQLDLYGTEVMRSTKLLTTMKLSVSVASTTASSSTSTGALIVAGGVGIAKKLYVGEDVNFSSTTASNSTTTGALTVGGGIGLAGALRAGGIIRTYSTTTSTTINTGALLVDGGCGIHENLNVGGTFTCGLGATDYTNQWGSMTGGANVTITARLVHGKCTLQCEGTFTATASDTASVFGAAIATKYRPAADIWFPVLVSDDGTYSWLSLKVQSTGYLYIGSWGSGSAIIIEKFSVSYYVASPSPPE